MKWEYDVGWLKGNWQSEDVAQMLTKKGVAEWELVSVIRIDPSERHPAVRYIFFFKRPLSE